MSFQLLNRKIHIYTGLLLFLFIFLFAFSGFMLNHRWKIWDYWPSRKEHTRVISVTVPETGSDLEKARTILSQTEYTGEIHFIAHHVQTDIFEIKTTRPGQKITLQIDLSSGKGDVKVTDLNGWELMPALHLLTGLHSNIPDKKNWFWTRIWSLMMDLTAIGLLILLVTGFYLWLILRRERRAGLIALEIGCTIFVLLFWILSKF